MALRMRFRRPGGPGCVVSAARHGGFLPVGGIFGEFGGLCGVIRARGGPCVADFGGFGGFRAVFRDLGGMFGGNCGPPQRGGEWRVSGFAGLHKLVRFMVVFYKFLDFRHTSPWGFERMFTASAVFPLQSRDGGKRDTTRRDYFHRRTAPRFREAVLYDAHADLEHRSLTRRRIHRMDGDLKPFAAGPSTFHCCTCHRCISLPPRKVLCC